MTRLPFELIAFPGPGIPEIKFTGCVVREGNVLTVLYSLSGTLEDILFPSLNPNPGRKNELWLATCFEFFVAIPGQPPYWEFNLSPSGDWNAFHIEAYRQIGFREEALIQNPRLEIRNDNHDFQLETILDLNPILGIEKQILMGVTSVIQTRAGHKSYWALTHPDNGADFHLRESFTLKL